MSKERLEEMENKMVEFRQFLALVTGHNDILNKAAHIHEIVIEQAERVRELEVYVDENSKKNAKLNEFLQKRETGKHLGKHVVDVVMEYVQELEHQNDVLSQTINDMPDIYKNYNKKLLDKNKRYRELLELVIDNGQCSTIDNIVKELYVQEGEE